MKRVETLLKENAKYVNKTGDASHAHALNIRQCVEQVRWGHVQNSWKIFNEGMLHSALAVINGGFDELDEVFVQLTEKLAAECEAEQLVVSELGTLHTMLEQRGEVKPNKGKLYHTPVLSLYEYKDKALDMELSLKDGESALAYLREELSKDTMASKARAALFDRMGIVLQSALNDDNVDDEFLLGGRAPEYQYGSLTWKTILRGVFFMGLAYKLAELPFVDRNGNEHYAADKVERMRAELDFRTEKSEDEVTEFGHYDQEFQAEVEEAEYKLAQRQRVAEYHRKIWKLITAFNKVSEWGHVPTDDYPDPLILSHYPEDKRLEERDVDNLLAYMGRVNDTGESLYQELKAKAAKKFGK